MGADPITIGIGAGVSLYSSYQANRGARSARRSQEQMHGQQMDLAREQMGLGRDHYNWALGLHDDYRQQFDPVLGELTSEAMADRTPDYGMITADTQAAFDSARGADQRSLERYGINPGDGQWAANNRRYGIGQAAAEVGARQQARRTTENDRYTRLANLYGVGMGLQGQAMQGMGQGMGAFQSGTGMGVGAAGQQAGFHGQQAGQYGQMAGQGMAGGVRFLGHMIDGVMGQDSGGGGANFWAPTTGSFQVPGLPGSSPIGINQPRGG